MAGSIWMRPTLAAIALFGLGAAADAAVIASATYPVNFSFSTPTAEVPLRSTPAGPRPDLRFDAPAAGRYVLTFSAECSVNAPADNSGAWIDIDVVVNGTVISPTNQASDAFCGANGTLGFDGWVRPSITVVIPLNAGRNLVSITGRLDNGATGGWLSDSSIVIHD